jgi:phytanoyl-CoA hydroxylase
LDVETPRTDRADRPPSVLSDARSCYKADGFVVRRGIVPDPLIDRLLEALRREVFPSRAKFYRQNTARYEPNHFTKHGYLANALLDPHAFRRHRAFSRTALELFFCEPLLDELVRLTGHPRLQLTQTMLMDANPKTPPHQDWWYPDTVHNGNLIAAWVALEDIDERAGRFYVMRDSQRVNLHEDRESLTHREWLARMSVWEKEHLDQLVAPDLRKGDVLFWNSSTIHGSLPTRDERFSRKSVTAHYIPEGAPYGDILSKNGVTKVKEYRGSTYYKNQPDYSRLPVRRSVR